MGQMCLWVSITWLYYYKRYLLPIWMDSDNSWNPRISSFKNKITFVCRVNLPLYCNILYEGNNLTKIDFYLFGLRKRNWFKNEYNFLELIWCAFNPFFFFFNIITFWFLMLKYSQETLKKTVPVDIWIQDCFHVLYLTNIFLVHLLETSINT